MSKTDKPTVALTKIEKELIAIVRSEALGLMSDLKGLNVVGTPETTGIKGYIGGHFQASWSMRKSGKWSWKIRNKASYADILALGRIPNGKGGFQGSHMWYSGLAPLLQKTSKNIEARSKKVRE